MAVYTDITDQDLDALLSRFDLGPVRAFKGIAEGVENSNFFLQTEAGRFILTVYERRVRPEDLPFFMSLQEHLAARGFPCPTPVRDREGRTLQTVRGKLAAVVSFLDGVAVREPDEALCREAGEGLARLHLAARGFAQTRRNDLGAASWRLLFEGRQSLADQLSPGLGRVIGEDLEAIAASWPTVLQRGIIHADLFPDNVFFMNGRFCAAIDFYFACEDMLAYDLAVCLNAWCFPGEGGFDPLRARALLEGYESLRRLSEDEKKALPTLAFGAAMRFFLTRLIDWSHRSPGALVRPKNPLEYGRKLDFHRAVAGRSQGLPI